MNLQRKALVTEVGYPETDGKPVAETDIHIDLLLELRATLKDYFAAEPDVYVAGNMLLYYVEGDPKKCVSPDVFVVRGVPNRLRRTYKVWEEGKAPDVVFEISSRSTCGDDLQKKWLLYARLGVPEYYIFDPEYDYLKDGLKAYRLVEGEYVEAAVKGGQIYSEALGLGLVDTGETLRLRDPQTGQFLPRRSELEEARLQAEEAREQAEVARRQAERARQQAAARAEQEAERAARLAAKLRELGVDPERL
jgi:Uma2 family endonuclease